MTQVQLQLPAEELLPAKLRKPVASYRRLEGELSTAIREARRAEQLIVTAELSDRQALADALRDGRADPGTPHTDKARTESQDRQRKLAGYRQAQADARAELEQAVLDIRDEWLEPLARETEAARSAYAEAVDQLARTRSRVDYLRAVNIWLNRFPHKPVLNLGDRQVAGQQWSLLLSALEDDATPPPRVDTDAAA